MWQRCFAAMFSQCRHRISWTENLYNSTYSYLYKHEYDCEILRIWKCIYMYIKILICKKRTQRNTPTDNLCIHVYIYIYIFTHSFSKFPGDTQFRASQFPGQWWRREENSLRTLVFCAFWKGGRGFPLGFKKQHVGRPWGFHTPPDAA